MSVESDIQSADPVATPAPAPSPANPGLLALMTFLPSGIALGLWFVGYLDTTTETGGLIPILGLSAGLFMLIATVWAGRVGANTVASIFGVFSAFWISFPVLVIAITSGWWGITAENAASIQSTYLLSFTIVFILLTLATLRLPMVYTVGFVLVSITFVLAYVGVSTANAGLFPIAGITTFAFCVVFGYVLVDGINQDLGGRAMSLGNPMVR